MMQITPLFVVLVTFCGSLCAPNGSYNYCRLGGPDPLDYINIYSHPGCSKEGKVIPPHWHYVSCGFSDLHGDDRVHQ